MTRTTNKALQPDWHSAAFVLRASCPSDECMVSGGLKLATMKYFSEHPSGWHLTKHLNRLKMCRAYSCSSDLSEPNPNVFQELGLCPSIGKDALLSNRLASHYPPTLLAPTKR